jgi:hypothetical protein
MQRIERINPTGDGRRTRSGLSTTFFAVIVALFSVLMTASCDQSSIFYDISNETEPKDPIIPGTPSRMVMFVSKMWVSNGTLYSFDGSGWTKETGPGATVRSLAVAGNFLYALTIDGGDGTKTRLWRTVDGTTWSQITIAAAASNYSFLDSIFAAGPSGAETLFVGAHVPADEADLVTAYAILYVNGASMEAVNGMTSLNPTDAAGALVGAAYAASKYYLATTMEGIFASGTANSGYALISGTENDDFRLSGLIALGDKFVAVGRGEYILSGTSSGIADPSSFSDIIFTGAIATWDETGDGTPDLLLVGIDDDDDAYEYGYREIVLNNGSLPSSFDIKSPGNGTPTTVADDDQYDSALGREAVNHLFQYNSGGKRILFASTFSDGLWSYRDEEWNAEE